MWCSTCRQDVPAIPAPHGETGKRCLRCSAVMPETAETVVAEPTPASRFEGEAMERMLRHCPVDLDDWQLDADLRAAERMIKLCGREIRIDEGIPLAAAPPVTAPVAEWEEPPAPRRKRSRHGNKKTRNGSFAWLMLSLGIMAFVCGGVLMVWSYVGQRDDLWNIGLPCAMAGQAGLIIGLIMQLDGLWQTTRDTSATLQELDGQLTELRSASRRVHPAAPARQTISPFHAHFGEQTTSTAMLADIKGQLELVSAKLERGQS